MIWRRLSALFVGLAFAFATAAPLGMHHCPVHDGTMSNMDAMPGMHGGHHAPGHGQSHQCTCLGESCCTAAITVLPDRLITLPVVPVRVVRSRAVARPTDEQPTSREDVLLPPPLGPPASLPV
jgi:hypothetical protein